MDFRFTHVLAAPVQAIERTLMDPATLLAMPEMSLIGEAHLVERTEQDGRIRRVARFVPAVGALELPAFADPSWAAWEERVDWDLAADAGSFEIVPALPPRWAQAFTCWGTYQLLPHPQGTERVIEGELHVHAPLIGARVEQYAVERLRQMFDEEAQLLEARS